jgi:hypothetical protein
MDMALYVRVFWRFKFLVATGIILAISLAFLSYMRVDLQNGSPKLSYRGNEEWASYARLFVTRRGFSWGSSIIGPKGGTESQASAIGSQISEENRFASLAILYSSFADSDAVRAIMRRQGPIRGKVQAAPLPATDQGNIFLPLISIAGIAHTPEASKKLASRAATAMLQYIQHQQESNGIPPDQRIDLVVVNRAGDTKLLKGRPKTLPAIVFLTVMLATLGLALLRENLNPRLRPVQAEAVAPVVVATDAARRSA